MSTHAKRYPLLGLSAAAGLAALLAALVGPARPGISADAAGVHQSAAEQPATPPPTCVPAPKGLLAWWPFEALEGGEPRPDFYRDWAGVNNHAELGVAPGDSSAMVGDGIDLDGQTQFLDVPDHVELDLGTSDFTIDAWVKLAADATGIRTIVDKRSFGPTRGYALFTIDGQPALQLADGSAVGNVCGSNPAVHPCTIFNSLTPINDDAWHFVAVSVQRSGESFFYIDGANVPFSAALRPQSLDNAAPLRIGRHAQSAALWKGSLDELEIFNRALSEAELASIRGAGALGKCSPEGNLRGVAELVNFDAENVCGAAAAGVRLTLSDFQSPGQSGNPYEANSAYFSFDTVYEVGCPNPAPGIPECNPFTPDQARPVYGAEDIALVWNNARTEAVVPAGGKAHFGYTLTTGDLEVSHAIRADWLLPDGTTACSIFGDSTTWAMPPPGSAALSAAGPERWGGAERWVDSEAGPAGPGRPDAADQASTAGAIIRNPSPQAMRVDVWGFGSPDPLPLDELVSSNTSLWRMAGGALVSEPLAPGAAISVTFPIDPHHWGAVLITDWYDGDTNTLRARSFRARPLVAAAPTPTPSPTSLPAASPSPTPSPSSPPPASPSPTPTPSATLQPATLPPTGTPPITPSATPTDAPSLTPTEQPTSGTPTAATPVARVCPGLGDHVPGTVIASSLANPETVSGWGLRCDPFQPPSPTNVLRTQLGLQIASFVYHPLFNGLVFRCDCP